ncbi:MAG: metal-sensitive transcriptional regulator [Candidatus Pacebacteria bacterium]|nr:metal-sensitive transcriptional regulator [Candidatus Paceibacterota bacterium]MBT3512273.1 metal-sensitive transcriptional regulator [Candidatus Paceibacterota bacterium]MBT4005074.1 metal-sensitive transcriptional regulator [Candidatus Paceibacterota bacterium]MBT4358865.1 metal-sensitive transcriptional regulator [Candidatus Paceibacterota bacterium]MBT4681236.1 metal-sensitive transcriptional regulator [Candidatus Paceibacterota bacterium]
MTQKTQDPILTQLKRICGQLDGVTKMYDDERACIDIVRQIVAVRSSLGRVARDLLTNEATSCRKDDRTEDLDAVLKEIFRY